MFSAEPLFDDKIFMELGSFTPEFFVFFFFFVALKNFWLPTWTQAIFFVKRSILNVVWQCSKYVFVTITALLCNWYSDLILCTASEFWHIQFSIFSGICRHIQWYSALLRHSHRYWATINAFWGIFSTLCNPRIYIHNLAIFWALVY